MHFSKYASLFWRFPERVVSGIGPALVGFQLLACLLTLHSVALGQQPKITEDQVKAAYLFNFAKMADWHRDTLPDGASPLVIGVSGGDEEFLSVLKATVAGKIVGTHPLQVKAVSSADEMKSCHMVFFRATGGKHSETIIADLTHAGVLSVGEDESFLRQGGMINLVRENGSVRFEVNSDALDRSAIHFSSKILALAKTGSAPSHDTASNAASETTRQEGSRRVEHSVTPEYPAIAERMKLTGIAQVEALVNPDGTVKEVRVVGGHPLLVDALVRAVKEWKYQPAGRETVEVVRFSFGPP
jgi:TonB family protein